MNFDIIGTGSRGNCLEVRCQRFTALIDCGVPYKALRGRHPDIVLLTHEHGDHFRESTVRSLERDHPGLYWFVPSYLLKNMHMIFPYSHPIWKNVVTDPGWGRSVEFGGASFTSFNLFHDAPNVGWVIEDDDGQTMMYATDTASMDGVVLKDLDYYYIEANYDEDELAARIREKEAAGQYCYERRVRNTHLSRQQAERWLGNNAGPNSKYVFIHEHSDAHGEEK